MSDYEQVVVDFTSQKLGRRGSGAISCTGDLGFLWFASACQTHLAKAWESGLDFVRLVSGRLDAVSVPTGHCVAFVYASHRRGSLSC